MRRDKIGLQVALSAVVVAALAGSSYLALHLPAAPKGYITLKLLAQAPSDADAIQAALKKDGRTSGDLLPESALDLR